MAIQFDCPYCTTSIRVPDGTSGRNGKCPRCEQLVQIPNVEAPDPPPAPEEVDPSVEFAIDTKRRRPVEPIEETEPEEWPRESRTWGGFWEDCWADMVALPRGKWGEDISRFPFVAWVLGLACVFGAVTTSMAFSEAFFPQYEGRLPRALMKVVLTPFAVVWAGVYIVYIVCRQVLERIGICTLKPPRPKKSRSRR